MKFNHYMNGYLLACCLEGANESRACEFMIAGGDPLTVQSAGTSCLHFMAAHNWTRALSMALERGANIDLVNAEKETPLHWAAQHGSTLAALSLLEAGAGFLMKSRYHKTPLHYAVEANCHETASAMESFFKARQAKQEIDRIFIGADLLRPLQGSFKFQRLET